MFMEERSTDKLIESGLEVGSIQRFINEKDSMELANEKQTEAPMQLPCITSMR